jgi:DNA-binding SARP family transcriptional activator/predicted ATPase
MQALLAYLALHSELPQPRQRVAFLFWPDASEPQAHNNLRQLLHQLRRVWPAADRYLAINTSAISWRGDVDVHLDVAEFVDTLALAYDAGRQMNATTTSTLLEQAVAMYRGDLLPQCYDEWITLERERLGQRYRQALDQLVTLLEEQRNYDAAIGYADKLLRYDRLDEDVYRRLMRLHALNQNRASALRVYHACATTLRRELAVEPSLATRDVYERLVQLETSSAVARVLDETLPLVGREREWSQVQEAWRRAVAGEAHLLLLGGEPGIGKSRLAEELVIWADRQGLATASARAYAAEGRLAYGPVADWLRGSALQVSLRHVDAVWLCEVARLLPELLNKRSDLPNLPPLAEPGQRQRFFLALAHAVLAAAQPLLLLLDDVHWCDPDTLEWLHFLLRFDPRARLLVMATARTDEMGEGHQLVTLLTGLRSAGQITEIALEPLDVAATAQLGAHVLGRALDPAQGNHLYRESEGIPLFVVETARMALTRDDQSPALRKQHARALPAVALGPTALPPKVHALIAARLAQLSNPARELASLAATIGRAFTIEALTAAYPDSQDSLIHALDELWRRRIVREHGADGYDFTHDKIREVAYSQSTSTRRRLLHRRVAQALEQIFSADLDRVSAQVAAHYEHSGQPGRAIAYYHRAAEVAQRIYANEEAIVLLQRGQRLLDGLPASQERDARELAVQTALGVSLVATKGYGAPEVMAAYRRSRELCQRLGQQPSPPLLRALATASITHAEFRQAHDLGDHLLTLAERDRDPVLLVEAHYVLSMALFWSGAFAPSRAHLELALGSYRAEHSPTHISLFTQDPGVVCLMRLALDLWLLGHIDQAREKREESVVLAQGLGHPFSLCYALAWGAMLSVHQRDAQAAREASEAAISVSREFQFTLWLSMGMVLQGWAVAEQGEVAGGIDLMRSGIATFQTTGSVYKLPYFNGLLAEQWGKQGHPEQGLALLNEALTAVEMTGERWCEADLHRRRGDLLLCQGDTDHAEMAFRRALAVARYQRAKTLELRAATSLARLWQCQGRRIEAHQMLGKICRFFPEELDTPELSEARSIRSDC